MICALGRPSLLSLECVSDIYYSCTEYDMISYVRRTDRKMRRRRVCNEFSFIFISPPPIGRGKTKQK